MKTEIIFCGQKAILTCDGKCNEAWGINWSGPKNTIAPIDPGSYEGGHAKPTNKQHNKWCARECERSELGSA